MGADYYSILGVERSADENTIKKAYRKLAMKYHPDKNPDNKDAENKFKEAARAYEVLGNPEKRSRYDRFGESGVDGYGHSAGFGDVNDIFSAFGDIFGDFFGGGQRRQSRNRPRRGADLRYVLEVDLKEVLSGTKKEIGFDCEQTCEACSGSGAEEGTQVETCGTCGGQGQVVRQQGFFHMQTTCPTCSGQGTVIKNPCKVCRGSGRELIHRTLEIDVPAGIDNGTQLRLTGEGEAGHLGGPAGDLYVELSVKPHKDYYREGNDLISHLNMSYTEALLGTSIEVETLEGKETVDVPRGTATGEKLLLKGHGVPSLRGGPRGHLVYQVEVEFPQKLKKREEELLREIAELRGETVKKGGKGFWG